MPRVRFSLLRYITLYYAITYSFLPSNSNIIVTYIETEISDISDFTENVRTLQQFTILIFWSIDASWRLYDIMYNYFHGRILSMIEKWQWRIFLNRTVIFFFVVSNELSIRIWQIGQFIEILFFHALEDPGLIDTTHGLVIKSLINIHRNSMEGWEQSRRKWLVNIADN